MNTRLIHPQLGIYPETLPTPTKAKPLFSGVNHSLKGEHWLDANEFKAMIAMASSPYIGKIPKIFTKDLKQGDKHKVIYQALDELTPLLRTLKNLKNTSFEFKIASSQTPIQIKRIDSGGYGTAYKMNIDDKTFAFKVYKNPEFISFYGHGSYGEMATGLYFSKEKYADLAQFHFGNPEAGWAVFEFISKNETIDKRPKQSFQSAKAQLKDHSNDNRINDIRIDYGGITENNIIIKNIEDYKKGLNSPSLKIRKNTAQEIKQLSQKEITDAYIYTMQTQAPELQAIVAQRLNNIGHPQEKKLAFISAMNTNNEDIQALVLKQLHWLPSSYKKYAFKLALKTKSKKVQAMAISKIYALEIPSASKIKLYRKAMNSKNPQIQIAAIKQIGFILPKELRTKAFKEAMAINNPSIQAAAASQIHSILDTEDRRAAYDKAMATNNPIVQEAAIQETRAVFHNFLERKEKYADYVEQVTQNFQHAHSFKLKLIA